jgi:hypothetical protein
LTVTEKSPRGLLRLRGVCSQLANARGGDSHWRIIPALGAKAGGGALEAWK